MLYPVLQDPLHQIVSSLFDRPRGASIGQMLFGAGEQGGWYDVSDMSTLFQNSAGTTPVTAVEQPVGLMLDKSGRGNHAAQATTTKRPVYSRLYNLLTDTETPNSSPVGVVITASGDFSSLKESTDSSRHGLWPSVNVVTGVEYVLSCRAKRGEGTRNLTLNIAGGAPGAIYNFDSGVSVVSGTAVSKSSKMEMQPDGDFYCELRFVSSFTFLTSARILMSRNENTNNPDEIYVGDGTSSMLIKQIDFRLATDAHLPYQWVNTATDYDADPAKFPAYLRFDGVDDALQTGNIDFTSTDKMTVWAGVTKLSDAGTGTVVELSAEKSANNGVFALFAPLTPGVPDISWYTKGTDERLAASTSESAPVTRVTTGIGDISGDISSLRVNGAVVQTQTSDQGTGNYGNYPLYIGSRAGTSIYFNGRLYSLIVRGAQSSLSQIAATEAYIKQKMRLP